MTLPSPISRCDASFAAVAALDDLVNQLVKASRLKISPQFFDWIADEATPFVEHSVAHSFGNPKFVKSLQMGDPKIALARWVRHWVGPWIVANFGPLAVHLPEFADSRPASLLPVKVKSLPAVLVRFSTGGRPAQVLASH